ncbi:hypothetical protein F511_40975 [Dorcoceras hygrometricum]|uniref:Uncharacterized protein n=1 Tax=Dorcoceras hygrometricum TaxID=472368 RepID=A0A2Z7D495_9LAMI|nr:hypothetical protein F511_40975 [Dorcoceras hygrometricum]
MAELPEQLVGKSSLGIGQSANRGFSHENPHEKFKGQRPKCFQDKVGCAIYMLRDDAIIWWEETKLTVDKALRDEQDLKEIGEERHKKRQAFL